MPVRELVQKDGCEFEMQASTLLKFCYQMHVKLVVSPRVRFKNVALYVGDSVQLTCVLQCVYVEGFFCEEQIISDH